MSDIVTTSWSETDAGNNQTPPEGWPAGMFPNAVEPSARMNMGALKRFWNRVNPVYLAQWNTSDAFVVSPAVAIAGYGLYETWRLRFSDANVSTSPTINISSIGALPLKKYNGFGGFENLLRGDIQAQDHEAYWDGTRVIVRDPVGPRRIRPLSVVANITAPTDTNENALWTITVPPRAMGINGLVDLEFDVALGGAGSKTVKIHAGGIAGTSVFSADLNGSANWSASGSFGNLAAFNSQQTDIRLLNASAGTGQGLGAASAIDTTAEQTLVMTVTKGTGSDSFILKKARALLIPG